MSNINIRPALIQDLDFIYNSLGCLFTEANQINRFSQTKKSLTDALFSKHSEIEVLLAELNEYLCGFAMFSMTNRNFTLFPGPGLYLHDLYVDPEHRRNGIATALIKH